MKTTVVRILNERGLNTVDWDIDKIYQIGKDNIVKNIEYYYDKDFTCNSVFKHLFESSINKFIDDEINKSLLKVEQEQEEIRKIQEKNSEINKSIQYAKSLQQSILPTSGYIQRFLKKQFLFYLPKDTISGDFYWCWGSSDSVYFAVGDCTGHGVPGGMVSVVCANAIKHCIREKIWNVGEILDKTRDIVMESFDEQNDGMDIIICKWDKKNKLEFSGANRPLWILREDSGLLEEFKTNKQPVGRWINPKPFEKWDIEINNGDTLYLFSDGYADQFGENDKKFKIGNLKNIIYNLPSNIEKQGKIITDSFNNWKGDKEQTDDVCLWAIKLESI